MRPLALPANAAMLFIMAGLGRLALVLMAALAGFVAVNIVAGPWAGFAGAAGLAVPAWAGTGSANPIVRGALVGAGWGWLLGFAGGFVGPIIFTPEANQGPLLGLFITGPGGVLLGALAGAAIAAGKPG